MMRRTLFLLSSTLGLWPVASWAAPPGVTAVHPAPQELRAETTTTLELQFDQAMDRSTADARSVRAFGRWSGPAELDLRWEDSDRRLVATPSRPFSAGETVSVYVARSLRSTQGEALVRGHSWQFWIATSPAPFAFVRRASVSTRRPGEGLVRSYGGYGGDLNADGHGDLAVTNEVSDDLRIFYNDGLGNYDEFDVLPLLAGGGPSANEGADFNHDGSIDLVVGNAFADATMVLLGDGAGGFEPFLGLESRPNVRAVGVLDLDGDACEDIISACMEERDGMGVVALFHGDGSGGFSTVELMDTPAVGERALAVGDADGDGILDVFVASDPSSNLQLLLGDGEGGLRLSSTVETYGSAWVVAAGDLNGDGRCDAVTAGGFSASMAVVLSGDEGQLGPATLLSSGSLTVSVDLGDLDGDGDLDIVGSNLFGRSWTLYRNDGLGNFGERLDLPATEAGSCAILHDRDGDGVLDLTTVDERADELVFFERLSPQPRSVRTRIHWSGPNPLDLSDPAAAIHFEATRPGLYRFELFDSRGRLVSRLLEREFTAGESTIQWSEIDPGGIPGSSALYWLRMSGPGGSDSHGVVILR